MINFKTFKSPESTVILKQKFAALEKVFTKAGKNVLMIADSLFWVLDETVFKNLAIIRIEVPIMPK